MSVDRIHVSLTGLEYEISRGGNNERLCVTGDVGHTENVSHVEGNGGGGGQYHIKVL